jgi:hypothetical protein
MLENLSTEFINLLPINTSFANTDKNNNIVLFSNGYIIFMLAQIVIDKPSILT